MGLLVSAAVRLRRLPGSPAKVRAGRAVTAVVSRLGVQPVCEIEMRDGSVLRLDARSRTEAGAFWNGTYEPGYARLLRALADVIGSTVYDVGANVGLIAVPLARHLRGAGQVICFEPDRVNCDRLRHNVALNELPNCAVHETALGDHDGEVRLAREAGHNASSGNAVILAGTGTGTGRARHDAVSTVRIRRIDDLVRQESLPLPALVKLDVEGSEVGFLTGGKHTLATARPVILGEFHSGLMPTFGTTFLDAAAALPPDYAIFAFAGGDTIREVAPYVGLGDVLLVPRERVSDLPLTIAKGASSP